MATAFQQNAFQNNAFQIDLAVILTYEFLRAEGYEIKIQAEAVSESYIMAESMAGIIIAEEVAGSYISAETEYAI